MFRIWIYLNFKFFFKSICKFGTITECKKFIKDCLKKQSKKKNVLLFSQCRVAFYFILKFLIQKTKKKEVIICAYNLPEMINIIQNLNLKIKFCDLNQKTSSIDISHIKENISKNTLAVVITNIFNNYNDTKKIRNLAKKYKIPVIEDNAIYFDNFTTINNKKYYAGSLGDFSIYSFNIMKNISSFYGGAAATNNKDFKIFYENEEKNLKTFSHTALIRQILIFFILKIMSVNIFYKYIIRYLVKVVHELKIKFLLEMFYPSLKKIDQKFPKYYFSKISEISLRTTYLQLKDKKKRKELFFSRKNKHRFYKKKFSILKKKNFNFIKTDDENYQNFLDFPLLVKNKNKLNKYLLKNGIEVRFKHYYNCAKMFKSSRICPNAERYERELVCFPTHFNIKYSYINFIANKMNKYF